MKTQLSMFWGTVSYEFRMQWRRRGLWVVMGLLMVFLFYWQRGRTMQLFLFLEGSHQTHLTPGEAVVTWADEICRFLPIALGILLADRFPRDRQLKVEELLITLPMGQGVRLWGKYVGSFCATIVPIVLYYCIGVGVLLFKSQSLALLPTALLVFLSVLLPGLVFVGAFALVCPAFMWWPVYCFCFTAYWFWGNLLSPAQHIPTISASLLTPLGAYMSLGFFGVQAYGPVANATALQASESLCLLVGVAVLALFTGWGLLRWQQARR